MIKVGSKVSCRLFNWPEGKFYGEPFVGEVIEIDENATTTPWRPEPKKYLIERGGGYYDIWMARKELKEIK